MLQSTSQNTTKKTQYDRKHGAEMDKKEPPKEPKKVAQKGLKKTALKMPEMRSKQPQNDAKTMPT